MKRRVIVPYTEIHPLVKRVLDKENPEYVQMTDTESYFRLLCDIWSTHDEDFILIEHDILPWPGAIDELWKCPGQWCTYTYEMNKGFGIHHAFGCTKIGHRFIEEFPDLWSNIQTPYWRHLDAQMCEFAQRNAVLPHPHRPAVIHLHGIDLYEPIAQKAAKEDPIKKRESRAPKGTDNLSGKEKEMAGQVLRVPVSDRDGHDMQLNVSGDRSPQDATREVSVRSEVFYDGVPVSPPVDRGSQT